MAFLPLVGEGGPLAVDEVLIKSAKPPIYNKNPTQVLSTQVGIVYLPSFFSHFFMRTETGGFSFFFRSAIFSASALVAAM